MPTADEHLQQHMGAVIASLLVQIAVLRAECDRLRAELGARTLEPVNGAP